MMPTMLFEGGGYRFLPGVFQYSGGVAAEPGFRIERARFSRLLPLADGFAAIEAHLRALGRPVGAFCAAELRSPKQFTEEGFHAFNRIYVEQLTRWGIFRDGRNPVARSNVCPEIGPPAAPSFYAFCYTVPGEGRPSFVAAGSGEAREGGGTYRERIVRLGDISTEGMRDKVRFVVGEMARRIAGLGFGWEAVTATQAYTVHDIYPVLADEIVSKGATPAGFTWHYARPPVEGLDFEMDVRGLAREILLD